MNTRHPELRADAVKFYGKPRTVEEENLFFGSRERAYRKRVELEYDGWEFIELPKTRTIKKKGSK